MLTTVNFYNELCSRTIEVNDVTTDNLLSAERITCKLVFPYPGPQANFGISHTDPEYVVCIDVDTKLLPNAVSLMMRHFADEDAGAVAGNVKVGNEVNILTHWQSIEYISSQNIDRNAFAYFNGITVVPGAIGAFRKQAIEDAGGFTTDTLAEDCDLTIRILRCGYNSQPAALRPQVCRLRHVRLPGSVD